jgi:phosphate transport system permease protein
MPFILFLIMLFLVREGIPLFSKISLTDFLTGSEWYPTSGNPRFGVLPLIIASVSVTILASAISIPLSLAVAIYLAELAGSRLREFCKTGS